MKRLPRPALAVLLLPLTGCLSIGPDYRPPVPPADLAWSDTAAGVAAPPLEDPAWWETFHDPLLSRYLAEAGRQNFRIQAAAARVERALALRRAVRAETGPQLELDGGRTRSKNSRVFNRDGDDDPYRTEFSAGLNASWELDLFGGGRRATEAATARLAGEVEQLRALRLATLTEVARNYVAIRGAQRRIAITEANINLLSRTAELIENLYRMGEASEFDVSRARGQLQFTQARLPALDAEFRAAGYRLSILLGQPPATVLAELTASTPDPILPDVLPLGQTSDLLRRRPDIRAAERALAASSADIGASAADLFPRFFLLGGIGRTADTFEGLESSLSTRYLFSSFVRWPIFQSGQIRARVRAEEAEAVEALALYEQTVLEALADAESALIRYLRLRDTTVLLREARDSRQRAVALARQLYEAGEENFLSVLDAERELITVEDERIAREIETVLQLVTLYAALGGGWEPFETGP